MEGSGGMSTHAVTYQELHHLLFARCVETPKFLHETDFGHFTLDTFKEPPCWKQSSARLSDYGACKSIPLALHRRHGDDITLLLPFDNHNGTSIWIWQRTWDVNQQFAVRIAKPMPGGNGLMYPHHETAYFAIQSKSAGVWRRDLLSIKNEFFTLRHFETAADIFLDLLDECITK